MKEHSEYTGPVSLAPIDTLVKELQSRSEASIICIMIRDNKPHSDRYGRFFHGNVSTCIGMLEQLKHNLILWNEKA